MKREDGLLTTEQLNDIVWRYTDKDKQTFALGTIIKEIAKAKKALDDKRMLTKEEAVWLLKHIRLKKYFVINKTLVRKLQEIAGEN